MDSSIGSYGPVTAQVIIITIIIIIIIINIHTDRCSNTIGMIVMKKETEKKIEYKNLNTEMQRMWNMKCFVTAVIIWTTEIVTKGKK